MARSPVSIKVARLQEPAAQMGSTPQCSLALVHQTSNPVDVRHATFAQVAFDFVAVGQGGREPFGDLRHGAKL